MLFLMRVVLVSLSLAAGESAPERAGDGFVARSQAIRSRAIAQLAEAVRAGRHRDGGQVIETRNRELRALLADFEDAPRADRSAEELEEIAEIHELALRWTPAGEAAREALEKDPRSGRAYVTLTRVMLNQKQHETAERLVERAEVSPAPDAALLQLHALLATARQGRKEYRASVRHAERLIELRLKSLTVRPETARAAALDLERVRKDADRMTPEPLDTRPLCERILKGIEAALAEAPVDDSTDERFVRESVARHLRAAAEIHLDGRSGPEALTDWLEFLREARERRSCSAELMRAEVVHFLRAIQPFVDQPPSDSRSDLLHQLVRLKTSFEEPVDGGKEDATVAFIRDQIARSLQAAGSDAPR